MDRRSGKRKRVYFPKLGSQQENDPSRYVDLPVIQELPIIATNGWLLKHRFINAQQSGTTRDVDVRRVTKSRVNDNGDVNYDEARFLDVERVRVARIVGSTDVLQILNDPPTTAQLYKHRLNNLDPAPGTPENAAGTDEDDVGHFRVHYVRFYKDNDDNNTDWITVEYIDQLRVVGSRGQVFRYKFKHLTADDYSGFGNSPKGTPYGSQINDDDPYKPIFGYCSPDLELIDDETAPWRLDPLQNIVNIGGGTSVIVFWAFVPEQPPGAPARYHFRLDLSSVPASPPYNITLADGRQGVVTGTFPTVPDYLLSTGGLNAPWWYVGPETDNSGQPGYNYYDIPDDPNASFTHTWPFYAAQFGGPGPPPTAVYAFNGSFGPVTFGPVALSVEGVPWTLKNLHVAFAAVIDRYPDGTIGSAAPSSMGWQPYFSAEFQEP